MRYILLSLILCSMTSLAAKLDAEVSGSVVGWMTGTETKVLFSENPDFCIIDGQYCRKYQAYISWSGGYVVSSIDLKDVKKVNMSPDIKITATRSPAAGDVYQNCFEPGNINGDLLNYEVVNQFNRWVGRSNSCEGTSNTYMNFTREPGESDVSFETRVAQGISRYGGTNGRDLWIKNKLFTNIDEVCIRSGMQVVFYDFMGQLLASKQSNSVLCGPVSKSDNRPTPVICTIEPFDDIDFGVISISELGRSVSASVQSVIQCDGNGGNYKLNILRSSMNAPNLNLATFVGLTDGQTPNKTSVSGSGKFTNVVVSSTLSSQTLPSSGEFTGDIILNVEFY